MAQGRYAKKPRLRRRHFLIIFCSCLIVALLAGGGYIGVKALSGDFSLSMTGGATSQNPQTPVKPESTASSGSTSSAVSSAAASSTPGVSSQVAVSSVPDASSELSSSPDASSDAQTPSLPAAGAPPMERKTDPTKPYQALYPDLYVDDKPDYIPHEKGKKVVYLTFDDGPSNLTLPLLDVLDQYNVKATFFVVGKTGEADIKALQETVKRGHAIAIHTYTHDYRKIYASPEAFLDDFKKQYDLIYDATGVKPTLYRYAGGSVNGYNKKTAKAIIEEMNRRGFIYYDWNVDSGDATSNPTAQSIYDAAVKGARNYDKAIILFHNTSAKKYTLQMMPKMIEAMQAVGCTFAPLDQTVAPTNFPLPKS